MFARYLNDLKKEFRGYNLSTLLKDLLAGLTVAAVALPLALAFGVSSGADAASGLITAIVAGVCISLLGGAFYQISGPTGAMAAILMSVVANYQMQGVFLATLMAGILLLLAGLLRLGRLTTFIPAPVITGFTSGIAVIIALGQVDNFFGVTSQGDSAVAKLLSYRTLGFSPNWTAVGIGLFVVVFMLVFPKKWNSMVPASLIGIVLATAFAILLGIDVPSVGEIPKTLFPESRLSFSSISLERINGLLGPAISIALLGMIESLLCGASAGRMTGVRLNSNQELIAQGIGNMLVPFFGGIPATAAIARTSVAIKSGAKTRLTSIFHAVGLLLAMFALGPVMSRIPLSALAGVLMVTAWRMNEWHAIRYIFSHRFKGAMLQFFVTMVATVLLDLTMAIVIGIAAGLLVFISRSCSLEVAVEDVDLTRLGLDSGDGRGNNWAVVYITGPMFFMTADVIEQKLEELAEKELIIFSMRGVPSADITTTQMLIDYYREATGKGKRVLFSSLQPTVRRNFERAGLVEIAGEDAFYFSVDRVLKTML
ncbi:MAG: SulP family inorganic anion transporter [Anaerotruncus sp.]|jgi:SulP family sulfate permease|nr:SulP family inorganic anion transporter [Anaerotruncus sp.]